MPCLLVHVWCVSIIACAASSCRTCKCIYWPICVCKFHLHCCYDCVFVFSTQAACSTDITVIIPGLDTSFLSAPCKSPDSLRMHQYYAYKNPFLINQPQSSLLSFCLPKKIKVNTVNKDAGLKNPSSRAIFTILCLEYELQQLIILFSKSVRLVSTFPGSL